MNLETVWFGGTERKIQREEDVTELPVSFQAARTTWGLENLLSFQFPLFSPLQATKVRKVQALERSTEW